MEIKFQTQLSFDGKFLCIETFKSIEQTSREYLRLDHIVTLEEDDQGRCLIRCSGLGETPFLTSQSPLEVMNFIRTALS